MGDRSQRMVLEQLQQGAGVGAVISPRDLSKDNAVDYSAQYHELNAQVLYDPQFHVPSFSNAKLDSYPISQYRNSVSTLHQINSQDLGQLASTLETENRDLATDAVIAPAIVYEAQRPDILNLNARLHHAAKQVGDSLGKPTYATVVIGLSAASSTVAIDWILSSVTGLNCDGWYFAFEFDANRLPTSRDAVARCCSTGLTLACTGKPVLHAYAGPLGLLSPGFGATGIAIGHSQNLWRFCRERWAPSATTGGDQSAPPRFFSTSLWGTIVYPDETQLLSPSLRTQVFTHSLFSQALTTTPAGQWTRWDANKHLINVHCTTIDQLASQNNPRASAHAAIGTLQNAVALHTNIHQAHIQLRDSTNTYQANWQAAMNQLLSNHDDDFDYLDLLAP